MPNESDRKPHRVPDDRGHTDLGPGTTHPPRAGAYPRSIGDPNPSSSGAVELSAIPDRVALGAILAWRNWRIFLEDGLLRSSLLYDVIWPPQDELVAQCENINHLGPHCGTGLPSVECTCGIHAYTRREDAIDRVSSWSSTDWPIVHRIMVVGQVSLWGTLIEHEYGWRASHAYPYDLTVPRHQNLDSEAVADELRRLYAVEVNIEDLS